MPPSLTDQLALDRTQLANERTFLAYLRTALGFMAAGGTLWRLFPLNPADRALGVVGIGIGAGLLVVGVWRFLTELRRYRRLQAGLLGG
ncbi:MAG: DUF202 domain-containing protein [Pseudomonadota bacterium]|nr:DUF202 domain-containing protein [Pseudomonadota bacterium]